VIDSVPEADEGVPVVVGVAPDVALCGLDIAGVCASRETSRRVRYVLCVRVVTEKAQYSICLYRDVKFLGYLLSSVFWMEERIELFNDTVVR